MADDSRAIEACLGSQNTFSSKEEKIVFH
jgi:hypothetical protein